MKTLEYKGVKIFPVYNSDDEKFEAEIVLKDGSTAFVNGADVPELKRQFRESVDMLESMGKPLEQSGRWKQVAAEKLLAV